MKLHYHYFFVTEIDYAGETVLWRTSSIYNKWERFQSKDFSLLPVFRILISSSPARDWATRWDPPECDLLAGQVSDSDSHYAHCLQSSFYDLTFQRLSEI